jgi:hypothetical protein
VPRAPRPRRCGSRSPRVVEPRRSSPSWTSASGAR